MKQINFSKEIRIIVSNITGEYISEVYSERPLGPELKPQVISRLKKEFDIEIPDSVVNTIKTVGALELCIAEFIDDKKDQFYLMLSKSLSVDLHEIHGELFFTELTDSIGKIKMIADIENKFSIQIPDEKIAELLTVEALFEFVTDAKIAKLKQADKQLPDKNDGKDKFESTCAKSGDKLTMEFIDDGLLVKIEGKKPSEFLLTMDELNRFEMFLK